MPKIIFAQIYGPMVIEGGAQTIFKCPHGVDDFEPFILNIEERPGIYHFFPALMCLACDAIWIPDQFSNEFFRMLEKP